LFRGGEPISLGHRAVVLLRVLVEQRGIPVSENALMDIAWAGLTVEESNLAVQIEALCRVFGDPSVRGQSFIFDAPWLPFIFFVQRQRKLDNNRADLVCQHRLAGIGEHIDLVAQHCDRGAVFDRQLAKTRGITRNRPAGLGLPPVIEHRLL
jgi:hypothetical protein